MPNTDTPLRRFIVATAISWSLFQLWIASPLPFELGFGMFNNTEARAIHLGFAIFLAFLIKPFKSQGLHAENELDTLPAFAWRRLGLALVAALCASYLFWFYSALADRAGAPTGYDIAISVLGVLLLLEATRRALGWALTIVAAVFLFYTFAGPYMPEVLAYKGASLGRVASHQWLSTEGVFGVALGVSTGFVFLFVLFGAMLQTAGAGQYFIRLAFSLLGHLRGGPAKAGVLASGLTGLMSGSSIANVVTTGTFTIPLMKRVGFPAHKAGAIEVAASTNGQLLPPVMGAAAFLMVEYTNTPYSEVIKHAFLPAVISYLALMYMVHLEAVKADMRGLPRLHIAPFKQRLLAWGLTISGSLIFFALVYWLLDWLHGLLGAWLLWLIAPALLAAYIGLLWYSARQPEAPDHLHLENLESVPPTAPVLKSGLHYLLPVVILIWCLLVLNLSPGLSAFYAIAAMIVMLLTQHPLRAWLQGQSARGLWREAAGDLLASLRDGALNMVGVALATATAGIVVGTVSLTGVGLILTEVVELLSMGSLLLVLILTGMLCMILGMGLPTTANYIVVSTLMAPVVVTLGQAHGLEVPLIAVHLFVFYFGIMADDTPPVGLAAFAAAGIAKSDPIKTGLQSFAYDIRTALLPFMFIFNTEMLMIGVETVGDFLWIFTTSLAAMLLFVSVTQNWFLVRNRWWESVLLLLVVFTLFRPGYWRDQLYPPYQSQPLSSAAEQIAALDAGQDFRLQVEVDDGVNPPQARLFSFTVPAELVAAQRLQHFGLDFDTDAQGQTWISDVGFMSPAEQAGLNIANDNRLLGLESAQPQPAKEWFVFPAFVLLGVVVWSQRRRKSAA